MADYILSFLIGRLENLIWDEIVYLFKTKEEVERVVKTLEWIRSFLKKAEAELFEDELFCRFVLETREIASDIEDVIAKNPPLVNLMGCFKVRAEIDRAFKKLDDLSKSFKTYNLEQLRSSIDERIKEERERRATLGHPGSSDVVGFENNIDHLVNLLTRDCTSEYVVSISGIGGSGKTTLAKAVYNHVDVRKHFTHFGWVYISRHCEEKKSVWRSLLIDLVNPTAAQREEILKMEANEIASKLSKLLEKQRCLLVIDDIWTAQLFNSLFKDVFPQYNPKKSKVLLTTRNRHVALFADVKTFLYEMKCLDEDESWNLLKKKARLTSWDAANLEDRERMEVMGKKMLKHCAGLPLAITLLGGILSYKSTIREWDDLQTHVKGLINTDGTDGSPSVSWVLSLSYYELPQKLKPCFLFLAHFPEKFEIRVKELCDLWIAEGFILEDDSNNSGLEYTAYDYADQLLSRYMVQTQQLGSTGGRVKTICVHDLVRDFCLLKAEKDNFLLLMESQRGRNRQGLSFLSSQKESLSYKVRRVALHVKYNVADELKLVIKSGDSCLRSFICFDPIQDSHYEEKLLNRFFRHFSLLRILKLEKQGLVSKFYLSEIIGKLVQLRLLSLKDSHIRVLSSAIRKLSLLQSLDLRSKWSVELPNMVWDFKHLRQLYLPQKSTTRGSMLRFDKLEGLETLVNVSTMCWDMRDLKCLINLKKLTILVDNLVPISYNVDCLRSFTLKSKEEICNGVAALKPVLKKIYKMELGVPLKSLPEGNDLYNNLVKLTLRGTLLGSDQMSTLGNMRCLEILRLYDNALKVKVMSVSREHFPRLRSLFLVELQELEEWTIEENALQNLHHLHIESCKSLKEVPEGLRHIELVIKGMPRNFGF